MKKILSFIAAAAMAVTGISALAAEEKDVRVFVDGREIAFADQQAVIVEDRTLVPARGVFEAAGCSVNWFEDEERVSIDSADNKTRIALNIGDAVMRVYTFRTVVEMDRHDVELDVAPQLMNDRTMLPLRAISEALGADVDWDEAEYTVTVDTIKAAAPAAGGEGETPAAALPRIYLKTDKDEYAAGDEIIVSVYAEGLGAYGEKYKLIASTVTVLYDKEAVKYGSVEILPENKEYANLYAENPEYLGESVKIPAIITSMPVTSDEPIELARLTFTANAEGEASFAISNKFDTKLGNATMLEFASETGGSITLAAPDKIIIEKAAAKVKLGAQEAEKAEEAENTEKAEEAAPAEDGKADDTAEAPEEVTEAKEAEATEAAEDTAAEN